MKYADLAGGLRRLGWVRIRQGRRHEVWGKGPRRIAVPRHVEINRYTAEAILKEARGD